MRLRTALLALALLAPKARAQYLTRPALPWRTIRTEHFDIHFPAEAEAWSRDLAARIESATTAVSALVGNRPARRVTVMIEDPFAVSNGFALPFLEGPVIFLWPTPPTPSSSLGESGDWGELLAVHEYGHIAHLTFESRNPRERLFWRLMPVAIGPVARKAPAWVYEGYATLIEGRITGSGRPHSVGRAAIIRQWAREGRLPTYGALDASSPFLGGSMRYLVGSAFLEWLERRKGPESLNHVWRRMSARVNRSFDMAFAGVYGAGPASLYGRFFAEVTADAMRVEREIAARGDVEGEMVQRRIWYTGEPAVSPDDSLLAVVVRSPDEPSKLVVWRTGRDAKGDSARAAARERMLRLDPLDVAPFDSFPPPKRPIATLPTVNGRGHDFPRFFADGARILVSRAEPRGDGSTRPDLFVWNWRTGALQRITHGASIREADPSPDGRRIVGARCVGGVCDLVLVDTAGGAITTLVPGSPRRTWSRPRWSPDGRAIAASRHQNGRWETVVVHLRPSPDPAFADARPLGYSVDSVVVVGPSDGVERYSPEWTSDGRALVVVSETGGIANVARIDLATNTERALTRVVGGVMAPTLGRASDATYFLSLHATGYDVRRVDAAEPLEGAPPALDSTLAPVVADRATPVDTFPRRRFDGPSEYGIGPRRWRVLPGGAASMDGAFITLALSNTDPVGRVGVLAQGGWGSAGAWRGGSLRATLRRWPVRVEGSAFATEQNPSRQWGDAIATPALDARYDGASLGLSLERDWITRRVGARAGASLGSIDLAADGAGRGRRSQGYAGLSAGVVRSRGRNYVSGALSARGSWGNTLGGGWTRALGGASLGAGYGPLAIRAEALLGRVTHRTTTDVAPHTGGLTVTDLVPPYEDFTVGGTSPPFTDPALLSQRIALPAVPLGYAVGRRLEMLRVTAPGFALRPYAVWLRAGDPLDGRWQRVLGLERDYAIESLAFARLPGVTISGGAGYSLDEPFRKRLGAYLSITYQP